MKKALFLVSCHPGQSDTVSCPEWEYTQIKRSLVKGWNTWDTRNVLNQVYGEDLLGCMSLLE